jgi:hypothetical protein
MRRALLVICLPALAVLIMPDRFSGQESKSQTAPSEEAKPAKKDRVYAFGVFGGKVVDVNEDDRSFVLRIYGQTREMKVISVMSGCG